MEGFPIESVCPITSYDNFDLVWDSLNLFVFYGHTCKFYDQKADTYKNLNISDGVHNTLTVQNAKCMRGQLFSLNI